MITKFTDDIRTLQEALASESCTTASKPFVRLGDGNNAPILNYNIPQSAGFTMYGYQFVKGVGKNLFRRLASEVPLNNFFDRIRGMSEDALRQEFTQAIRFPQASNLLFNSSFLERYFAGINSDWKTTAELRMQSEAVLREDVAPIFSVGENILLEKQQEIKDTGNLLEQQLTKSGQLSDVQKDTSTPPIRPTGTPVGPVDPSIQIIDNTIDKLMAVAIEGYCPMIAARLGGYGADIIPVQEPKETLPYFFVIEEYTVKSYLGDYGAGRTIKTFSLLPGEKTTITVRTYKENNKTKSSAENVLDSFSESSAREMESMIEEETGLSNTLSVGKDDSYKSSRSSNVSASVSGTFARIAGFGASGGRESASARSSTNTSSATRSSNTRSINKALDRHVAKSNSNRSIDVNTSSEKTVKEGEETSIVRELENVNKSRVLNFVFRQLLQQYVTITYLSNIRIAFCNGYEESLRVVDVEELDRLLEDTVLPSRVNEIRQLILKNYCMVYNYKGNGIDFVEEIDRPVGACMGFDETEKFWRIRRNIKDSWKAEGGGLEITVPGPILNVATHTLRTSSIVVDAMLGQGEALDSFSMRIQDAAATSDQLENVERLQQVGIVQGIEDPVQRAEMYRKVFGNDCFCDKQNT